MVQALLLIDFQEGWRDPKYPYYLGDFKSEVANAQKALSFFRARKWPVVFTRHVINEKNAERFADRPLDCFVEGTPQVDIMQELAPRIGEPVIQKHRFSAFFHTSLSNILQKHGADRLVVAGIMTNCCVRATLLDAYYRDFALTVLSDACGTDSKKTSDKTLAELDELMYGLEITETDPWIGKQR